MELVSRGSRCMGAELGACSAVISVWKCGKKDPVHHKRGRKCEFQFSKSHEEGSISQRDRPVKTALFTDNRVIQEMEWTAIEQLGACPQPAGHG